MASKATLLREVYPNIFSKNVHLEKSCKCATFAPKLFIPRYMSLFLKSILGIGLLACTLMSCGEAEYVPKPKGFNRIDLPVPAYQSLAEKHPFSFEHSKYSHIRPDSASIAEPHWLYVIYPKFKANVQLTYKSLKKEPKYFSSFIDDSHKLTSKHYIKATSAEKSMLKTPSGKNVAVFELEGDVPSQFQFYVTDSTTHFLRGALYFRTATKNDSLAPVIEYIKSDIVSGVFILSSNITQPGNQIFHNLDKINKLRDLKLF